MIKAGMEKIASKQNLSIDEAYKIMYAIMNGEANEPEIAGLLLALKTKGETAEEVAGFAKAMRAMSLKINTPDNETIDVCGTGGDYSNTFNISTAVAFVVAGAGVKVAKHGNRSISSKSGSADVLTQLGVNINLTPVLSEQALEDIGITFLFAPNFHPAMKYAAPVRKALAVKTVFNILGPLTNPAGTKRQLIGAFNNKTAQLMAQAAQYLDMDRVCFVCTSDSLDEISLTDKTEVFDYQREIGIKNYSLTPESFGYNEIDGLKIKSNSISNNSDIILSVLRDREINEAYYVIAANAALALKVSGISNSLSDCCSLAEESILSGKAYEKLLSLKKFGEKYS